MGGNMESLGGNIAFETQRKGETWGDHTHVEECLGGAEEFKMTDDGLVSRYQVVSSKINGWSGAAKVGKNVVSGSFIDENILICPYHDDIEWTPMVEPSGTGGMKFLIFLVVAGTIGSVVYHWRKIDSKDTFDKF